MTDMCQRQMYGESYNPPMPSEMCEFEAEPGSDYCGYHTMPDLWDLADEAYERSKEPGFCD